jgi:hypothetical protein
MTENQNTTQSRTHYWLGNQVVLNLALRILILFRIQVFEIRIYAVYAHLIIPSYLVCSKISSGVKKRLISFSALSAESEP